MASLIKSQRRGNTTILYLSCSPTEWAVNGDCERIAHDCLKAHPEVDIVEIREHAGWYETYCRDAGKIVQIATANDSAEYSPHVLALRRRYLLGPAIVQWKVGAA